MFAYLDKKNDFLVLNNKKGNLEEEILKLKKFNSLLGEDPDMITLKYLHETNLQLEKKVRKLIFL